MGTILEEIFGPFDKRIIKVKKNIAIASLQLYKLDAALKELE